MADIERRAITDRAAWLEWRTQDVTASDVACLFGVHPFGKSALSLWAEKSQLLDPMADNPTLQRGRWGEAAVLEMVAEERPAWTITRPKLYLRDPATRLGATPDAAATDPDRQGLGIIQAKTVTRAAFESWPDGSPPLGYVLQTLTEALLAGAAWATIAVLVMDASGWEPQFFDVERHPAAEARIQERVAAFWRDFAAHRMPALNPVEDAEVVRALYPRATITDPPLDLGPEVESLLEKRDLLRLKVKEGEAALAAIDTDLRYRIGEHAAAIAPGWRLSLKNETRKAYSVAASEHRVLRVTRQTRDLML